MSKTATMNSTETTLDTLPLESVPAEIDAAVAEPEQLTLLPAPVVPPQFRLDEQTRHSGLQHVAQLRAQIAAQAANRNGSVTRLRPPRRQIAA